MHEVRVGAGWITGVLLVAVAALLLHDEPRPFGRADAEACGVRIAGRLGYVVQAPTAVEHDGSWEVSAAGDGLVLHLVIRGIDERITDVAVWRGAESGADVLTRDERLVALQAGCG